MWPKILAQLIPQLVDLLPHVKRVVPMADKFLSSKAASDAAIAAMAAGVRTDLGEVANANAGLSRQMNDLGAQIATVGETAEQARTSATALGDSVATLHRELRSLRSLLVATLVFVVLLAVMVAWLLLTRSH